MLLLSLYYPKTYNFMFLRFLASLIFLTSIAAQAQPYSDVIYLNQGLSPLFDRSDSSNAQIFETNFTLRAPIFLKDSSFLLFSSSFNRTYYQFLDENRSLVLGGGYLGLIYSKDWTPTWSSLSTLQVGSFSNFRDYNWSGLQYLGATILRWQYKKNLRLGVGFLAGYRVRFLVFVPLGEVKWTIDKHWSLLALAPGSAVINYQFNRMQGVGFEYEALGNVFSINRQGVDYLSESAVTFPWTYLRFGVYADQFLSENIALRLQIGGDVARNLLAFDRNNDQIEVPREQFILGTYGWKPFLALGIYYRVRN